MKKWDAVSWHKVSNILKIVDNPEKVKPLIQGLIGLDSTADFIQTLREVKDLPDLKLLLACPVERLSEYAPTSITTLWCLGYSLHAYATKPDKLVEACRLVIQLFPLSTVPIREDVLIASLSLLLNKYNKKPTWRREVLNNKTFIDVVAPKLTSIPFLSSVI